MPRKDPVKPVPEPEVARAIAKIGRPTIFNDDLAEAFLHEVLFGDEGRGRAVYKVCADPGMPAQDTIYRWRREKPAFGDAFNAVKEARGERYVEQLETIAKEMLESEVVFDENDRPHRIGKHDPKAAAVAVQAISQAARINAPKERNMKLTGADGGPVQLEAVPNRIDVASMSPTAREYLKAALLEMKRQREQEQS